MAEEDSRKRRKKRTLKVRRLLRMWPFENRLVPAGANGMDFAVVKALEANMKNLDPAKLEEAIASLQEVHKAAKAEGRLDDAASRKVGDLLAGVMGSLAPMLDAPSGTVPANALEEVAKGMDALATDLQAVDVNAAMELEDLRAKLEAAIKDAEAAGEPEKPEAEAEEAEEPEAAEVEEGEPEAKEPEKAEASDQEGEGKSGKGEVEAESGKDGEKAGEEKAGEGDEEETGEKEGEKEGKGEPSPEKAESTPVTREELREFGKSLAATLRTELQGLVSEVTKSLKPGGPDGPATVPSSQEVVAGQGQGRDDGPLVRVYNDLSDPDVLERISDEELGL